MGYLRRLFTGPPLVVTLYRILSYPFPLRIAFVRLVLQIFPRFRPHYYACLYETACIAKSLGYEEISIIEFGVAGGNGLLAIEKYCQKLSRQFGIGFQVYGFDMGDGKGLPSTNDARDLPYLWPASSYKMDEEALRSRLEISKLVIGNVADTLSTFIDDYDPAPLGLVFLDLDYYTSTMSALKIFDFIDGRTLPRVLCYMDDVDVANPYNGELAAITEFNESHPHKKIARIDSHHIASLFGTFYQHVFTMHDFQHERYNTYLPGVAETELELKA